MTAGGSLWNKGHFMKEKTDKKYFQKWKNKGMALYFAVLSFIILFSVIFPKYGEYLFQTYIRHSNFLTILIWIFSFPYWMMRTWIHLSLEGGVSFYDNILAISLFILIPLIISILLFRMLGCLAGWIALKIKSQK